MCEPPSTSSSEQGDESASADHTVELTIKSLKPPLTFKLSASPTSTIASLKQQLADEHGAKGAPPVEGQRWILKGKSMGDSKLLKEFNVQDGAVINLMVTKSTPAVTTRSNEDPEEPQAVPTLTLSEPVASGSASSSSSNAKPSPVSIEKDLESLPLSTSSTAKHASTSYQERIQQAELWQDLRTLLEKRFEGIENQEAHCQQAWEAMLGGCQEWIESSQKALIRERVGYSAMGGY